MPRPMTGFFRYIGRPSGRRGIPPEFIVGLKLRPTRGLNYEVRRRSNN